MTVMDVASANTSIARAWLLATPLGPEAGEHQIGEKPSKGRAAVVQQNHLAVEPTQGEKLANQVSYTSWPQSVLPAGVQ